MALHQTTRQSVQRVIRASEGHEAPQARTSQEERPVDESQTWVLFAPATDVTSSSYLCETEASAQPRGRSQLSEIGSLNTLPRTDPHDPSGFSAGASAFDAESAEDDAELDSLDSHLPEFRSLPGYYAPSHNDAHAHAATVLPGHDGLGSFRLDQPGHGAEAQEQIYQFETFNPRRVRRRRESLDNATPTLDEHTYSPDTDKRRWIEAWRLEHSRVLLEEVQRLTRREMKSRSLSNCPESATSRSAISEQDLRSEGNGSAWHDDDIDDDVGARNSDQEEGFLSRVARRVMRDLFGIDDDMLAVLVGEALPEEDALSSTPKASQLNHRPTEHAAHDQTWQLRILENVSRELGLLMHRLSRHQHPGAFSSYSLMQQQPLPYAGLPMIPEATTAQQSPDTLLGAEQSSAAGPAVDFQPTIPQRSQPVDILQTRVRSPEQSGMTSLDTFTQDEWERDLDIKLIFRYLRARFTSRSSSSSAPSNNSHFAASSTQDTAAKAARIRQHHPLVSRTRPGSERRNFKTTTPSSPIALRHGHVSSCASQSTKRSARRSSASSRHYWDIGGSRGTGSLIASHGPMGSWGEV